ncbi:penicillin-binding transpeptidase domain-containing protein [Nocardiopsis algeriensis]|uniref:penicillin-binding transpeptidase domain-containing protein n=1 Tax=Nocardiopsis algeriensis TaxID=1478215 RepID=UPI003B435AB9
MDERSPRQPDSSGPPAEPGAAPGSRPENPYRIPRPPKTPDPAPPEVPREPVSRGLPDSGAPTDAWSISTSSSAGSDWPEGTEALPVVPSGTPDRADPFPASDGWNRVAGSATDPRDPWAAPADTGSADPGTEEIPAVGGLAADADDVSPAAEEPSFPTPDTHDLWTAGSHRKDDRDRWDTGGPRAEHRDADETWGAPAASHRWDEPHTDQEPWSSGDTRSSGDPLDPAQTPWHTTANTGGAHRHQENPPTPDTDDIRGHRDADAPQAPWGDESPDTGHAAWSGPAGEGPREERDPWQSRRPHPGVPGDEPAHGGPQEHGAAPDPWEAAHDGGEAPAGWHDVPPPSEAGGFPDGGGSRGDEEWDDRPGGEAGPHTDGFAYLYDGGPGGPEGPERPQNPSGRKSRRGLLIGLTAAAVALLLIGGGVSWYVLTMPEPEEVTAEYEAAWEAQDYERLAAVTIGGDAAGVLGQIASGLGVEAVDVEIGAPVTEGSTGTASYEVTVSLTNAGDWGWEGELPLVREDGEWWVRFSPEVAYPELAEGQVLARTAVWGERGQILAADGTRLDTSGISGSLQMIVGETGEASEEDVERLGPAYQVGDTVGVSGLQRTYEAQLAGEAATTIVKVDAAQAEDPASLEATEENTVASLDGSDGQDVVTSIDMAVQNAASAAILRSDDPAGMVAIRPSTGEVLAAVNVPGGFNRAFEGQYPPGSVFKVISYSALLDNGMTMDTPMECPEEYDLGGWPFTNAGGAEYGAQSVTEAFATSCNTALVQEVGNRLNSDALVASAEQFGMNAPLSIGVPTFEPSFPAMDSSTMLGAQSIGQGQVLTSPLHMATVPAAVADGSWRHPVLVTEPAAEGLPEPRPIAHADALRTMMRAVITEGTAKDVPFEGEVHGKTGTAEYGTPEGEDEELPTHAWMVGFKGDVAFAVVVDGGGGGSAVAGPIAAAFTNAL